MSTQILVTRRNALLGATTLAVTSPFSSAPSAVRADQLNPQPLPPSPEWKRAMPPGPDARVKITESYARMVAREAYFWAWPMINIYNKRLAFGKAPEPGLLDGVLPFAPVNRLASCGTTSIPRNARLPARTRMLPMGAARSRST